MTVEPEQPLYFAAGQKGEVMKHHTDISDAMPGRRRRLSAIALVGCLPVVAVWALVDRAPAEMESAWSSRASDGGTSVALSDRAVGSVDSSLDLSRFPDASTTGVPPGISLAPLNAITVTVDGTVIDSVEISGGITVDAKDVIIRRSRVLAAGTYGITHGSGASSLIEDVEVVGVSGLRSAGISPYGSWTARRVNVHGFADGIKVNSNQVIERSWIHDLLKSDGSHNDAIQSVGGSHVRIIGNRIEGPFQESTSSLILHSGAGGPLSNYVIEENLLSGGTYTVYCAPKSLWDPRPQGIVFRNNVWLQNSWKYGPFSISDTDMVWEGNRTSENVLLS